MNKKDKLNILCREVDAIGVGWRMDWSEFDGRQLMRQLQSLTEWALSDNIDDITEGTEFLEYQSRD